MVYIVIRSRAQDYINILPHAVSINNIPILKNKNKKQKQKQKTQKQKT